MYFYLNVYDHPNFVHTKSIYLLSDNLRPTNVLYTTWLTYMTIYTLPIVFYITRLLFMYNLCFAHCILYYMNVNLMWQSIIRPDSFHWYIMLTRLYGWWLWAPSYGCVQNVSCQCPFLLTTWVCDSHQNLCLIPLHDHFSIIMKASAKTVTARYHEHFITLVQFAIVHSFFRNKQTNNLKSDF